ncbi:sugar ABC transporter substrate-binding protein [Faecalicatena contorta]|uniref:Monosaccharide ABC transporter substrate-binding protein, CUT2 family n=1 Tax=Faecalicatena contorta TaxID=39482 RepID=A0A316A313_9FIRM|nr:sugar ABC transporter substrate-binding protein [Faecalicatena contorta]PWJ51922.1 monosaccharide ABC transporter substrate-binding protein (CUT2 family) [Faecalicatena contorta]SUQ12200.1 monosaccharide ABC transporter substrate-binding protein, CUT2 family [Faecalicatena contorta]
MKGMKKVIGIVLGLVFVFSLTACNGQEDASAEKDSSAKEDSSTGSSSDTPLVAFSNKGLDYYFWTVCQKSAEQACTDRGWSFEASDAKLDSAKQFDQFVNFINKKPAAIIADSIDSEGLIAAADQAVAAGIPVAIVDTPLTGGDIAVTVAFDNYDAGTLAAEAIIKALEDKYGEAKGTVVNCYGAMSSEAWRLRKEGMDAVFAEYPNVNYIAVPAEGEIATTQDAVLNQFASGIQIDALHTPSDNPGQGLVAALKMENKWVTRDDKDHVIIVTIDGEPIANKFIEEGYYDYSIAQDGYSYGQIAVEMLEKYSMKGEDVPLGPYENKDYYWEKCEIIESDSGPYVKVPAYEINPDNCTDPRHWGIVAEEKLGIEYDMSAVEN